MSTKSIIIPASANHRTCACAHCGHQFDSGEGRHQCPACHELSDVKHEENFGVSSKQALDFLVSNHGSVCILTGVSDDCFAWIKENVGNNETQTWGRRGIVCEPRYIQDIITGLENEGFIGGEA